MTAALHILAAWIAISPIAGLLIARCIPPSTPHDRGHQRGEGNGTGRQDQTHNGWDIV